MPARLDLDITLFDQRLHMPMHHAFRAQPQTVGNGAQARRMAVADQVIADKTQYFVLTGGGHSVLSSFPMERS